MIDLAEQTWMNFAHKKTLKGEVSTDDILNEIHKLQKVVQDLKKEGINVWNAKAAIPKIFDIVDGSFEIMIEVVEKMKEGEKK